MGLRARLRQLPRDTGGTALIELAILAPLLLSLMCGLAEFGQLLRQYHIMEKGVRDASRYLAHVPANPACNGAPSPAGYSWAQAITEAKNLAVRGSTTGTTPLFAGWTNVNSVHVDDATAPLVCVANPRVNGLPLAKIKVTASAPYADLGMLGFLGLGPFTLTVSHEELKVF
jgi:Flp pilus assembly protein TadG